MPFSSRAGDKLDFALTQFQISVSGLICADFGCSTGGFTSCLLSRGAAKVYAVDTGYGVLDWSLRNDPRVIVMERTNALHVQLPQTPQFISVDVSWTPQHLIIPQALSQLAPGGQIVSLLKPHYEAPRSWLRHGVLPQDKLESVVESVLSQLRSQNIHVVDCVRSPLLGGKGKNTEYLIWIASS